MIILTDYISVHLIDLPYNIRGYTILNSDGSYTIIINAHLSAEMQFKVYKHELEHINNNDFVITTEIVDALEYERHNVIIE